MQATEGVFLLGGHLGFGLRGFVRLARQMQQAVDDDSVQLVLEGCTYLLGIAGYRIQGNINIAVYACARGIIKGDDIRIIVMLQELTVHSQNLLVVAEDVIQLAHRVTILRSHRTNPTLYLRVV